MNRREPATGHEGSTGKRLSRRGVLLGAAALLSGCARTGDLLDDLLGKADDAPLSGKREPVLGAAATAGKATEPVLLPQPVAIAQWTQPGGTASGVVGNPTLPERITRRWRITAAAPSEGANRISAPPIIVGNLVCVLDAKATVRAFHADSGRKAWERSLVPKGGNPDDGFGGGLCSDGRSVFAATGFGELVALSASSGAELWRTKFDRALRTPPVYANGRLFVRDNGDVLHALTSANGGKLWEHQGPAGRTRLISAAAPAVRGGLVVCPFSGGELVALSAAGGERWSYTLSAAATITDIAARPVIAAKRVYGVAALGDLAALGAASGEEVWSVALPGRNTPWLAGNYLFHVSGRNSMHAVHAASGKVRWSAAPANGTLAGPVMGGGRLLAASSSGQLVEILAEGGQVLRTHKVGAAVYVAPIVARNAVYVLDDEGGLSRFA